MIPWLPRELEFPPLDQALPDPNGLLAAGGDLSPERILAAYRRGIFPWFSEGEPVLWWSPDPRMVLFPGELKISRSLAKTLRNADYEIRLDAAFDEVVERCATVDRLGQRGTWITDDMRQAYQNLHRLGYGHSVETWRGGVLVGGLYGLAIGRAFFGESMFSLQPGASKIALAHLCAHLKRLGFGIIDCQMETAHLASLGARPISRREFSSWLKSLCSRGPAAGLWETMAIDGNFRRSL